MVFSDRLLAWYDQNGRTDLPWRLTSDPYRVWLSEIMLQQTQVQTVIPYYQRFLARFPSIKSLAEASQDEVLSCWSGLGYYARGRNLLAAAKQIIALHGGQFPQRFEQVVALPGVGRSTAGAILAICFGQQQTILDGNVKRVLARYRGIAGWSGTAAVARELWQCAEGLTPAQRVADYTQAIMDLGATLCIRRAPDCANCPVAERCQALLCDRVAELPTPRPRKVRPARQVYFLLLRDESGAVLLQQRPAKGLWGGLWGLPELSDTTEAGVDCETLTSAKNLPQIRHEFTHFTWLIAPFLVECRRVDVVLENPGQRWVLPHSVGELGIPTPVMRLLSELPARVGGENR